MRSMSRLVSVVGVLGMMPLVQAARRTQNMCSGRYSTDSRGLKSEKAYDVLGMRPSRPLNQEVKTMKDQHYLRWGLLMVALLSGCATEVPSTTGEMSPGPSGERIGGQAGLSHQQMISSHEHPRLANYYADLAQGLHEQAKEWEFMADFYEKHPEPNAKDPTQHAAHCRTIAQNYRKAAEEADALATEHRALRPHGMVQ